jgi:hypothetical protein
MKLLLLVLLSAGSTGCGVDSTRALWQARWVGEDGHGIAYGAEKTLEITGKTVLTPPAVTVDVMTDPLTWQVILETLAQCCR